MFSLTSWLIGARLLFVYPLNACEGGCVWLELSLMLRARGVEGLIIKL
jgi:hypothetical protein